MTDVDLTEHYRALKQFLVISSDASAKSVRSTSRAQREREKLLNLSTAQFKELSTHAFDELKRRIDESRSEPDYLLPKSSLHPKINQARQKMSSLPQSRFRDLVSDIAQEIERRGLNKKMKPSNVASEDLSKNFEDEEVSRENSHHNNTSNNTADIQNQSLQSKTVVPNRANLTWSSDEDEEQDDDEIGEAEKLTISRDEFRKQNTGNVENGEHAAEKDLGSPSKGHSNIQTLEFQELRANYDDLKERYSLLESDYDFAVSQSKTLSEEIETLSKKHRDLEKQVSVLTSDKENWEKNNRSELDVNELRAQLAALRLENQSLKNSNTTISNTSGNGGKDQTSSKDSKEGLDLFLDRLNNIDAKSSSKRDIPVTSSIWQIRYENLRSNKLSEKIKTELPSNDKLKNYVSATGLISLDTYSKFIALVESFLLLLNDKSVKSEAVFDTVSRMAIIGNKMANEVDKDQMNFNGHATFVRECITYLLTVTRYFAVFSSLVPSIIVERSVGELVFSVEELVASVKLAFSDETTKTEVSTGPLRSQVLPKSKDIEDRDFSSHVRPLKMTNRIRSSKLQNEDATPVSTPTSGSFNIPETVASVSSMTTVLPDTGNSEARKSSDTENNQRDSDSNGYSYSKAKSPNDPHIEHSGVASQIKYEHISKEKIEGKKEITLDQIKSSSLTEHNIVSEIEDENELPLNPNKSSSSRDNSIVTGIEEVKELPLNPIKSSSLTDHSIVIKNGLQNGSAKNVEDNTFPGEDSRIRRLNILDKVKEIEHSRAVPEQYGSAERESDVHVPISQKVEIANHENETIPKENSLKSRHFFRSLKSKLSNGNKNETLSDASDISKENTNPISKHEEDAVNKKEADQTLVRTPSEKVVNFSEEPTSIPSNREIEVPQSKDIGAVKSSFSRNEDTAVKHFEEGTESDNDDSGDENLADEDANISEAKQRQEYRKSMAAATFNIDLFDIDDPDNTLTQLLLYLEHQTVQVISTIQSLLSAIKAPKSTRGDLRENSGAICEVIIQMTDATNTSMNQTRNAQLKEHGTWVVKSLEDCAHRMNILCKPSASKNDSEYADKNFKQRLAGISFDIAKCTKELVKTVEEASLKEDIEQLNARLNGTENE